MRKVRVRACRQNTLSYVECAGQLPAGRQVATGQGMFNWFLRSIVIVPVLLGIFAARTRRLRVGLLQLVALVVVYDFLFILLLYYLRDRWVP